MGYEDLDNSQGTRSGSTERWKYFASGLILILVIALGVVSLRDSSVRTAFKLTSGGLQDGNLDYVTLYQYTKFTGQNWSITLPRSGKCVDFPKDAINYPSSILTNGNCVILHEKPGCKGRGFRVEDYTYGYDAFNNLYNQDNSHSSLRRCSCNLCLIDREA